MTEDLKTLRDFKLLIFFKYILYIFSLLSFNINIVCMCVNVYAMYNFILNMKDMI